MCEDEAMLSDNRGYEEAWTERDELDVRLNPSTPSKRDFGMMESENDCKEEEESEVKHTISVVASETGELCCKLLLQ